MHNMDRIMNEESSGEYGFLHEGELGYEGEWEWEGEGEGEYAHEGEWEGEGEYAHEGEWEWEGEGEYGHEILGEQLEYELAAELLNVTNEQELEQFLGKLISKVGRFAKSNLGRKLIGGLKSVAKIGLPILGKVAGGFFGGPAGAMLGSKLGSMATKLFEIQSEGMSNEDLEFEVARRFVRLSAEASKNVAANANRPAPPKAIVADAIKKAASIHAPGLLSPATGGSGYGGGTSSPSGMTGAQSGNWERKNGQIVLYGV